MVVQGYQMTFEDYCRNHTAHKHCAGCGICLYDPRCVELTPVWCVPCYERIDSSVASGVPRPWDGNGMVLFDYDGRFDRGNMFEAFIRASRFGQGKIILRTLN